MSPEPQAADPDVDLAFALEGRRLPRDHGEALADALGALLPWLAGHPSAGVHTVKVVAGDEPLAWLAARARLLLRVPRSRADELAALCGCALEVGGCRLRLGAAKAHPLLAHSTLYSPFVAARGGDDEPAFLSRIEAELAALGVSCRIVCGRRQQRAGASGPLAGYSLLLHGLDEQDSRAVLHQGLGPHRTRGCGIFVAQRSAAAA